MSSGYVYILSNEAMPGIVKIGMTTRLADARAEELYKSNTAVPLPFEVEFALWSSDAPALEAAAHENFEEDRVNNSREFFRVESEEVMFFVLSYEYGVICTDPLSEAVAGCIGAISKVLGVTRYRMLELLRDSPEGFWESLLEQREHEVRMVIDNTKNGSEGTNEVVQAR